MTSAQIVALQKRIGTNPDGFWGGKSIAACKAHLRALMPAPHPWPRSDQASLRAFYGHPEDNSDIISIEAPEWMRLYDGDTRLKTIQVHKKCAASLLRALNAAYAVAPDFARRYFGCHVDRNMRGGNLPSLHAYGAAIDLAASTNGNNVHWPTVADMPLEVMEAFAREGWLSAGAFWSRDSMHMQATQ